jgi:hapalindole-type alkaloid chlorinase
LAWSREVRLTRVDGNRGQRARGGVVQNIRLDDVLHDSRPTDGLDVLSSRKGLAYPSVQYRRDETFMTGQISNSDGAGHPIKVVAIDVCEVAENPHLIEAILQMDCTGVVIRDALPVEMIRHGVERLTSEALAERWGSPNAGMAGGEIRTIGDAATPTFTAFRGPPSERYAASAARHAEYDEAIFAADDPMTRLTAIFSALFDGKPATPPVFDEDTRWLPYNYRALDPGVQIYSHHDNHYGLPIYEHMDARYDREALLSWFVTVQPAQTAGQLIVYGLWGSDPNLPMLPTRFLDTAVLEQDYKRYTFELGAGDLVIFNSGKHVHRVSPVEGESPRLTLGGFLTADVERTQLAFWS